jgi:hypothetical protein
MQIVCPACGVSNEVPVDATVDAPVRAPVNVLVCGSCGKRIRLGQLEIPETLTNDAVVDPPPNAYTLHRPVQSHPHSTLKTIVVSVVATIALTMVVVLIVVARHSSSPAPIAVAPAPVVPATEPTIAWDRAHRADLLRLKSQADQLAIEGRWQAAYDGYQQIITMVGDHDITDPIVTQLLAGTRVEQDRAMAALIANRNVPPAMTKPPTAEPITTAPAVSATQPMLVSTTRPAASQPTTAALIAPTTATTAPVLAELDPVQAAADNAPPLPGPAPEAPSLHAYTLPDAVTDAQIGKAINDGVNFLRGQFANGEITDRPVNAQQPGRNARAGNGPPNPPSNLDNDSNLPNVPAPRPPIQGTPMGAAPWAGAFNVQGIDALCVYSLLHAGQALDGPGQKVPGQKLMGVDDPFTQQILEKLKSYNLKYTYHRSLRAAALAVFNRPQDTQALEDDVRWLLAAGPRGAYTYVLPEQNYGPNAWDNSNSQYGLLGVWSGAQVGMAISQNYWHAVEGHWTSCANGNGTFGYTMGDASTTMTCAGVASLLVARDYIDNNMAAGRVPNKPTPNAALDAGLRWMDDGDNSVTNLAGDGMGGDGYGLYGLERVGLASGYKYFGRHDWYSELARQLVAAQHFDGSWGNGPNASGQYPARTLIDTAYSLLFLARGRHPILFNKLRYEGDWNNRPSDVSHLARYAGHALERPLNWQVVNLRRNWFDWMDAPVLYISGDKAPPFTPADYKALRDFANGGGLIFTHADGGSAEFNKWVADAVRIIFPKYELMTVPREHAIYSTVYPLKKPPPLLSVSNASRILLIHSPTDLGGSWQRNWTDESKGEFQLGVNIFVYAAGKGILKNRLSSNFIPEDPDRADSVRQIARLEYPGEWDPEPYAWARFSRFLQWETHRAIEPTVVALKELAPNSVPMAVLTGTVRHDFTASECDAAKAYVNAGGILLIDACGGSADFAKSVQTTLLPLAFANGSLTPIADTHPLLLPSRAGAYDLTKPLLRSYANQNGGKNLPLEVMRYGKGWVLFSRLDITTGLLGTQQWGILGYDPAYAQGLMKNAVLWAEARMPVAAK